MNDQVREVRYSVEEAEELLLSLTGSWEGTNQTWFEPGVLADVSPVRGTIRRLPGSRFVIHEYQSTMEGNAFQGIVLYGYNIFNEQFESAWADAFHMQTNILVSSGSGLKDGFEVLGKYLYDYSQPAWGWRTQIELIDPDHLTITAYNMNPQGEEAKAIETVYQRVNE